MPNAPARSGTKEARAVFWAASTYFAEGLPYGVVHNWAEVQFTEANASLAVIGLTSLFHLPWNLKFLAGPLIDAYGTRRRWMVGFELALALVLLALAPCAGLGLGPIAIGFFLLATCSALHDIAVDGYYLEALDEADQARFVGHRATAYRLALLAASGPLLYLIGQTHFALGFVVAAAVMAGLAFFHARSLPPGAPAVRPFSALARLLFTPKIGLVLGTTALVCAALFFAARRYVPKIDPAARELGLTAVWIALLALLLAGGWFLRRRLARGDSLYAQAFASFWAQPKAGQILAFVLSFRLGEAFLMRMKYPFFRDLGLSLDEYAIANGTFGAIAAIVGPLLGGMLIARHGLSRWLWPFVLAQNVPNLAFALLAALGDLGELRFAASLAVITIESLGAGFGTAVLMIYMMRCTASGHRAAHMALLTALMSAGVSIAGAVSGALAEALGFGHYFVLTFFAAVPGSLLLFGLPHLAEAKEST